MGKTAEIEDHGLFRRGKGVAKADGADVKEDAAAFRQDTFYGFFLERGPSNRSFSVWDGISVGYSPLKQAWQKLWEPII